ncbi:nucleophile aminohydrolase [Terfezia claveryi]|nr:nucleophile aminohydrolase [Terfezia claveryi]
MLSPPHTQKKYSTTKLPMPQFMRYPSRRSVVYSTHGMVACTQPLAAEAGVRVLREGGNAADAAVAVAAVLSLTEPSSTGIGGDMFCLYYNPSTQRVHSLNGSGRSPTALTLPHALSTIPSSSLSTSHNHIPHSHVHAVTVPGAAAGWCDTVEKFGSGKLTLGQILAPAIELAEEGVPISYVSAQLWKDGEEVLKRASPANFSEMLVDGGRAPREGEVIKLPGQARTYRLLAEHGRKGFYEGGVAQAIISAVQARGGVLSLGDLKDHGDRGSDEMDPISIEIPWGMEEEEQQGRRKRVWECAPNGQGLVALQTLGILEALQERGVVPVIGSEGGYGHNSVEYLHALITALRISFSDAAHFIREPSPPGTIPLRGLLSKPYLHTRSQLFLPNSPPPHIPHGSPTPCTSCDTVYFSITDRHGGGCSFINSLFTDFGSGIIPPGYGFPLHNRGAGFLLEEGHANALEGGKRPGGEEGEKLPQVLDTVFGVMGGYMQPQGHVQVLLNMLAFGMSPQEALDAPRICIGSNYKGTAGGAGDVLVTVEVGVEESVVLGLKSLGYVVTIPGEGGEGEEAGRRVFGRGQIIRNCLRGKEVRGESRGTLWSGASDMRGDGACVGY